MKSMTSSSLGVLAEKIAKKKFGLRSGFPNSPFDFRRSDYFVEVKAKFVPENEKNVFYFTPSQVLWLRSHPRIQVWVLEMRFSPFDDEIFYRWLDMRRDFLGILTKKIIVKKREGHGFRRLKFRLKRCFYEC